ncbi:Cof-type HAD-IIB family hydrolase [Chitinasiproducens palmae]|uniref:Cof-type HAD-IIB family hydrolase n=1 Tax=Chitinasiproducens palmae TaxID=1770053 RepID=UPI001F40AA16|nr:Cof-type HAD-IIB family hydrolase [Chitinasiproducens palmae]
MISDIDGTLLTPDKQVTARAVAAVQALRDAGIVFTLASSRPPVGLAGLVKQLHLDAPLAAFNGGTLVAPDLRTVLHARHIAPELAKQALRALDAHGHHAWVFARGEWRVTDPSGPYIDLESRTIGTGPTVVARFDDLDAVDKIVGVSRDFEALARSEASLRTRFGSTLNVARSQKYYLDLTDPAANKGEAVHGLARQLNLPCSRIAVLGDMANDVPMFEAAGLSVAMGQAAPDVQAAADDVTAANDDDGFAKAIERWLGIDKTA